MLPAEHEDRVRLQGERILHWVSRARSPPTGWRRFLGQCRPGADAGLKEQPIQSAPKKKAQERAKAAAAAA